MPKTARPAVFELKTLPYPELEASQGFKELVAEYAEETANKAIGAPNPRFEEYRRMDANGKLKCVGMFDMKTGSLVGLVAIAFQPSQHYDFPIAAIESLYLRKNFRKGTNGVRLVRAAKNEAKLAGAPGVVFMAPPGSRYDQFCEACRMVHTHNAWWAKV